MLSEQEFCEKLRETLACINVHDVSFSLQRIGDLDSESDQFDSDQPNQVRIDWIFGSAVLQPCRLDQAWFEDRLVNQQLELFCRIITAASVKVAEDLLHTTENILMMTSVPNDVLRVPYSEHPVAHRQFFELLLVISLSRLGLPFRVVNRSWPVFVSIYWGGGGHAETCFEPNEGFFTTDWRSTSAVRHHAMRALRQVLTDLLQQFVRYASHSVRDVRITKLRPTSAVVYSFPSLQDATNTARTRSLPDVRFRQILSHDANSEELTSDA